MRLACSVAAALAGLLSCAAASAQDADAAALVRAKEAAVFVKLKLHGRVATGSGFLFAKSGDAGLVATPGDVGPDGSGAQPELSIVFHSGSDREFVAPARVAACFHDIPIAVLSVSSSKLPEPLSLNSAAAARETSPIYILGFPLGTALGAAERNPEISVWRGTVTSLRKDAEGRLVAIQLDGGVVPGAGGSPVVDANGALIGIAVAGVPGSNIGLALPPDAIRRALRPRTDNILLRPREAPAGQVAYEVNVELADPLQTVRRIVLVVGQPIYEQTGPGTRKTVRIIESRFPLKLEGGIASGTISLKGTAKELEDWRVCIDCTTASGAAERSGDSLLFIAVARAKNQWRGPAEEVTKDVLANRKAAKIPAPQVIGKSLAGEKQKVLDASITTLAIGRPRDTPRLCWSSDARAALVLASPGILRRIRVPDLLEERRLEIAQARNWLGCSAVGLVLHVEPLQELWIVDEASLAVTRRIPIGRTREIATSPGLSIALVKSTYPPGIQVVDLKTGRAVRQYEWPELVEDATGVKHGDGADRLLSISSPLITPDGRYLFCREKGALHRFRIEGTALRYEEVSPKISRYDACFAVSADSSYVAASVNHQEAIPAGHRAVTASGAYVYAVTDLQKPVVTLDDISIGMPVGFDFPARRLYAKASQKDALVSFNSSGVRQREYALPHLGQRCEWLVHPAGGKLLITTSSEVLWIEFGTKD